MRRPRERTSNAGVRAAISTAERLRPCVRGAIALLTCPVSTPPASRPALSIVIPTVHRRESLLEVLHALDPASMPEGVEIIVADNAPRPEIDLAELESICAGRLRLLHVPEPGKWRCLNAVIKEGSGSWLADTIAVLDDDMTPMPGWAAAVLESVRSRPDFDLFTGKSHVVWPEGEDVPGWADHYLAQGVCFSVLTWQGEDERVMGEAAIQHPSGNHFWFRRQVLESVPAFPPGWTSEAEWCMEARARGHRGLLVPTVWCGHRVQPGLMRPEAFLDRALRFGHTLGRIQNKEDRIRGLGTSKRVLRTAKSLAAIIVWTVRERRARRRPGDEGLKQRARALLRLGRHRAILRQSR